MKFLPALDLPLLLLFLATLAVRLRPQLLAPLSTGWRVALAGIVVAWALVWLWGHLEAIRGEGQEDMPF